MVQDTSHSEFCITSEFNFPSGSFNKSLSASKGGGEIRNLLLHKVKHSLQHYNSFFASTMFVTFSLKELWQISSESADVEHDKSGELLQELLLLWMITSQSICLVPSLLLSPFLGFPGIDFAFWRLSLQESSK